MDSRSTDPMHILRNMPPEQRMSAVSAYAGTNRGGAVSMMMNNAMTNPVLAQNILNAVQSGIAAPQPITSHVQQPQPQPQPQQQVQALQQQQQQVQQIQPMPDVDAPASLQAGDDPFTSAGVDQDTSGIGMSNILAALGLGAGAGALGAMGNRSNSAHQQDVTSNEIMSRAAPLEGEVIRNEPGQLNGPANTMQTQLSPATVLKNSDGTTHIYYPDGRLVDIHDTNFVPINGHYVDLDSGYIYNEATGDIVREMPLGADELRQLRLQLKGSAWRNIF